jgi:hypothetical protein
MPRLPPPRLLGFVRHIGANFQNLTDAVLFGQLTHYQSSLK